MYAEFWRRYRRINGNFRIVSITKHKQSNSSGAYRLVYIRPKNPDPHLSYDYTFNTNRMIHSSETPSPDEIACLDIWR